MRERNTLKIRMFGEFSIQNKNYVFPQDLKKSQKVSDLLQYLIANKAVNITKENLMEVLWPNDSSGNPQGALRNLVYRARQEMQNFFPSAKKELILLSDDTYEWNSKIPAEVDIYEFEECYKLAREEEDEQKKIEYYKRMIDLYKGEFLPKSSFNDWVVFRNIYYKRIYMQAVIAVCNNLENQHQFDEIIDLCDRVNMIDQMDERIHEIKISAYVKNGETQKAMEYYYFIIDFFSNKLGLDIAASMRSLYDKIIEVLPDYQVDMNNLENTLRENDQNKGTFYCNYDTFKNMYRLHARTYKRTKASRFLALLTLVDEEANHPFSQAIRTHMLILKKVIFDLLRKNDIFTQFSASQYSLILETQNVQNCELVMQRINDRFEKKAELNTIKLQWEIKQIN